jgi:type II secretion system protein H
MTERRRARGMTLIELVVAMSVIALMAAIGIPAFNGVIETRRLTGAVERVANDLRTAQARAVTTGSLHRLAFTGGQYRLEQRNAASVWVPITQWYSLSTEYRGVSFDSIIDNNGAGNALANIAFTSTGAVDNPATTITFPVVLRLSKSTQARTVKVTRAGSIQMPTS